MALAHSALQLLEYVTPSSPHTGWNISGQTQGLQGQPPSHSTLTSSHPARQLLLYALPSSPQTGLMILGQVHVCLIFISRPGSWVICVCLENNIGCIECSVSVGFPSQIQQNIIITHRFMILKLLSETLNQIYDFSEYVVFVSSSKINCSAWRVVIGCRRIS